MAAPKIFMAASVPRYLRQTRLGYLPLHCIIGTRIVGDGTSNNTLFYDVVMLPDRDFQRMKQHVALQHIAAPTLKLGGSFEPVFVLTDTRQVVVQADDPDPLATARKSLINLFSQDKAFHPSLPPASPENRSDNDATDMPFWPVERES